jgi:putative phosphoribosyl transferase
VAVSTPDPFVAVGQFYDDFGQVGEDEVVSCLERAALRGPSPSSTAPEH